MLEKSLQLEPLNTEVMANLGTHWQEEGDLDRARSFYARQVTCSRSIVSAACVSTPDKFGDIDASIAPCLTICNRGHIIKPASSFLKRTRQEVFFDGKGSTTPQRLLPSRRCSRNDRCLSLTYRIKVEMRWPILEINDRKLEGRSDVAPAAERITNVRTFGE